jgi:hypothetical protein
MMTVMAKIEDGWKQSNVPSQDNSGGSLKINLPTPKGK